MKIIDIIREEAARNGFTVEHILSDDRTMRVTLARQYAMWRARKETARSWGAIGLVFKRDHTTAVHAYQKIEAMEPHLRGMLPALPAKTPKPVVVAPPRPERYYRGRDCIHGHGNRRYIATGACVECKRLIDLRRRRHEKDSLDARDGRRVATFGCIAAE